MPQERVLGVQLYSVRDAVRTDLSSAMRRIAEIGYPAVEPYDLLTDPTALADALGRHRLQAPAAHAKLLGEHGEELLANARGLGIGTLIVPSVPAERFADAASVAELAADLNRLGSRAREEYGIRIGYHNHHFELEQRIDGGPALEHLARLLDPSVVLEVDTYWAAVIEPDVPALLERLGERVRFLHIKDGPVELGAPHVAVGAGAMSIPEILEAAPHAEAAFVELDECDGDVFAAVADSHRYLSSLTGLAGTQGVR